MNKDNFNCRLCDSTFKRKFYKCPICKKDTCAICIGPCKTCNRVGCNHCIPLFRCIKCITNTYEGKMNKDQQKQLYRLAYRNYFKNGEDYDSCFYELIFRGLKFQLSDVPANMINEEMCIVALKCSLRSITAIPVDMFSWRVLEAIMNVDNMVGAMKVYEHIPKKVFYKIDLERAVSEWPELTEVIPNELMTYEIWRLAARKAQLILFSRAKYEYI